MTRHKGEYILLAGYRRFNAVKKLGWSKITAKVYNTDDVVELDLDEIELGDNSRKEEASTEIVEMMQSIKQNGLIQPIVVAKAKDLTERDFIALNLTENMQRKDLSPFEVALRIKRLKQIGLNDGEIAVRLGINRQRVKSLTEIGNTFSSKEMKRVAFTGSGQVRTGKTSYTLARHIALSRIAKGDKKSILDIASKTELSTEDIDIVVRLVAAGMKVKQAFKEAKNYTRIHPPILAKIKEIDKLQQEHRLTSRAGVIMGILYGKIEGNPKIFYQGRDLRRVTDDEE